MAKRFDGGVESRHATVCKKGSRTQSLRPMCLRCGFWHIRMQGAATALRAERRVKNRDSRSSARPVEHFSFSPAYGRNRFGSLQPIRARRSRVVVSDNRLTSCDPLNSVGGVSVISSPDHFFSPQLLQQFGGDFVQSFQKQFPPCAISTAHGVSHGLSLAP